MRRGRAMSVTAVATLATAFWVVAPTSGQTGQGSGRRGGTADRPATGTASKSAERASGVIVKVEKVTKGGERASSDNPGRSHHPTHRLTINTNAVWRDWARDQARVSDRGSARKDAREGAESVATKGEPADSNSLVLVDIVHRTKVETRFRAPDDETGKGSKTPDPGQAAGATNPRRKRDLGAVQFHARDLKPGLFVEVDYEHVTGANPAKTVTVIRPITGLDSEGRTAEPAGSDRRR